MVVLNSEVKQTALLVMAAAKWLPIGYRDHKSYVYERENNYPILWNVLDGLKRECIANGQIT